jgi:CRP-like cAMP-binding protein
LSTNGEEVAKLGSGRSMCEFALISHSPSLFTIIAKTNVVLLSLDRDCYRYISAISFKKTKRIIIQTLSALPLFCDSDPAQLNKLSEVAFLVPYQKGIQSLQI